ncbi:hypothetical protein BS50DRAFT_586082 [Corynespora cassiicola Philippines]|uniref:Zn(2)-C6 fungal-type domain-containing protein n=1 Tax=Corynespora cassiicola Philippines TaxID=1448308 RepID=A0A2T2NTD5_CORCC|nr:hypothetical protein BS50DRAFT_586082 [Corynespora cassiicola Philippines]
MEFVRHIPRVQQSAFQSPSLVFDTTNIAHLSINYMDELHPIACEHCRSKKCRCDRKLPSCSQCQAALLSCRYVEGGKRGIPAAYITALEARLQETENALYATLATLDERGGIHCTTMPSGQAKLTSEWNKLSKKEKQRFWERRPLLTNDQLIKWFRERRQQEGSNAQDPASQDFLPLSDDNQGGNTESSHSGLDLRSPVVQSVTESQQQAPNMDRVKRPTSSHAASIPKNTESTQWHNYF